MALKTGFIDSGERFYLIFHSVVCPLWIDVLNLYEPCGFFFTWKVVFIYIFIDLFSFCIYFIAKEVTPGSFAPLLCVFRRHQSRLSHHLTGQVNTGAGIIKAIRSPLSLGLARLQISVPLHQKCLQELCASGSSSLSGTAASRHSPFRRTGGRRGHRAGRNRSWTLPALNRRHTSIWGIYLGVQQWPHTGSPRSLCWIFLTWCRCPTAPWKAKRRFLMEASCGVSKIEVRKKRFFFFRDILLLVITHLSWHDFPITNNYARRANIQTRGHAEFHHCFLNAFLVHSRLQVTLGKGFTFSICRLSAEKRGWLKRSSVGSERSKRFTSERLTRLISVR